MHTDPGLQHYAAASSRLYRAVWRGLAGASIWGERMMQAWSTFPAGHWADVPLSDKPHISLTGTGGLARRTIPGDDTVPPGVLGLGAVLAVAFPLGGLAIVLFAIIDCLLPKRLKQAGAQ